MSTNTGSHGTPDAAAAEEAAELAPTARLQAPDSQMRLWRARARAARLRALALGAGSGRVQPLVSFLPTPQAR